jgi:dimethylamine monooxygenase subunit A
MDSSRLPPPARYFPVRRAPLRMEAGLRRFGTDFGNGRADALYFQRDREEARYLAAKAATPPGRHGVLARSEAERRVHDRVQEWMHAQLALEHPEIAAGSDGTYAGLAARVQEDFAVLHRPPREGREEHEADAPLESAIAMFVSIPSGWRPERLLGASFRTIHGPVPSFADVDAQSASMVASMIERGPYVRFVWTISADDHLDHHPEEGRRAPWSRDGAGWLRVERQVTVPFPAESASLFLIRVYLRSFAELSSEERATLAAALAAMPDEVARYKGLAGERREIALSLLAG